ncbi:MAG: MerR family transcriptional regulator [Deltaproteobacteria bacterium]|nr:MerR family transcriptional regulator [Deltaproteobacteria bacterium]
MSEFNEIQIPDRLFFKIGDVSKITGLKPYVLRYWESEFKTISPNKSQKNQRVYRREDIKKILLIKQLLHKERYSIEGAKKKIKELRQEKRELRKNSIIDERELKYIRDKLYELVDFTSSFKF